MKGELKKGDRVQRIDGVGVRGVVQERVQNCMLHVCWDDGTDDIWHQDNFELAPARTDAVEHPAHYTTGGIECYDAMSAMLSKEEMIGYLRGNSFKYRWRFRHKGGAEDLRKAEWYEKKLLALIDA